MANKQTATEPIETPADPGARDHFPRTISLAVHELRTPVTVVCGYLRMVLKEQGGPLTDKQKKMLQEAERSCERISALVAEMSELGKLESRELSVARQDIDLARLISDVASNMHEGEDRGVHLEVRVPDESVMVTGDRARLSAAIGSLLHASLRERGEPGVVVARCAVVESAVLKSAVLKSAVQSSGVEDAVSRWAVFAVGDETTVNALIAGAAHAPAPFDEWRGGLGLALPVARRVVEALGGSLWSAAGERPRAGSALRLPLRT